MRTFAEWWARGRNPNNNKNCHRQHNFGNWVEIKKLELSRSVPKVAGAHEVVGFMYIQERVCKDCNFTEKSSQKVEI